MADENATVEETTEEVTLPSEDTEAENADVQTPAEPTEDSDIPSEGDNTSEEESDEEAVEKLSPRYERDNKRLNAMLEAQKKELEALKSSTTPGVSEQNNVPTGQTPTAGGYELWKITQEVEALKSQLNQRVEEEFWEKDAERFDGVLREFPELKKNPKLLRMIKNDARAEVEQGQIADYVKTARELNKTLKFAEERGMENAARRESVVGQGSMPSVRKASPSEVTDFDKVRKRVLSNPNRTTRDLADLLLAKE
jgi:hypothetical protein